MGGSVSAPAMSRDEADCLARSARTQLSTGRSDFYQMMMGAQQCMANKLVRKRCPAGEDSCGSTIEGDAANYSSDSYDYLRSENTYKDGVRAAIKRAQDAGEACIRLAKCGIEKILHGFDAITDMEFYESQNRQF